MCTDTGQKGERERADRLPGVSRGWQARPGSKLTGLDNEKCGAMVEPKDEGPENPSQCTDQNEGGAQPSVSRNSRLGGGEPPPAAVDMGATVTPPADWAGWKTHHVFDLRKCRVDTCSL